MHLLDPRDAKDAPLIACFGLGLIGNACVAALAGRATWYTSELSFGWMNASPEAEDDMIVAQLTERCRNGGHTARLAFLWCAGRCGFAASSSETAIELAIFHRVIALATAVHRALPTLPMRFIALSSAGGLFEGMRLVEPSTLPAPKRPYGWLKLRQEEALLAAGTGLGPLIIRPSSVYGPVSRRGRQGLISVLIRNGIRRAVSAIAGTLATERDYVYALDVGRYVATRLVEEWRETNVTTFLVSGRPTTIHEICQVIERAIGRKLYVRFDPEPANGRPITFAPASVASAPWRSEDLPTAVRQLVHSYLKDAA